MSLHDVPITYRGNILTLVYRPRILAYACTHVRENLTSTSHARLIRFLALPFHERPLNARFTGLVLRLVFVVRRKRTIPAAILASAE